MSGSASDDQISGGTGNDSLDGGQGSDVLRGEAGDDYLFGGVMNYPGEVDKRFGGLGKNE